MSDLNEKHCVPCESGAIKPYSASEAKQMLTKVKGWELDHQAKAIARDFTFKNFYHTMAFVNAVAWIANRENHHPDMEVGYNHCKIRYSTHAINGLSENDFICAVKVDALLPQ